MKHSIYLAPIILLSFVFFVINVPVLHIFSYVVVTGSMSPTMPVGSLVYVYKSNAYRKGDVVTFKNKTNQIVTHRIFDIEEGKMITKGDANSRPDLEMISKKQVIGKSFFAVPHIGLVLLNFKKIMNG